MRTIAVLFTALYAFANMSRTSAAPAEQCLYPRESESRDVKSLDGIWTFVRSNQSDPTQGIRERWFAADLANGQRPTISMPVPASYNDITTDRALRDHVGTVWYDRRFFAPRAWQDNRRVWLRFGSVHYSAIVWVNGVQVVKHEFGHLPFQADITDALLYGAENRITVLCDNVLLQDTVPQGNVIQANTDNGKVSVQTYTFDFFNYAGIHRSVHLYTTPVVHIKGVQVTTEVVAGQTGRINYAVQVANDLLREALHNPGASLAVRVQVRDKLGKVVASNSSTVGTPLSGAIDVPNANLWWPYLMHSQPGYLYTLELELVATGIGADVDGVPLDVYRLPVGIRTLRWNDKQLLINERPVYLRGFGRHEDADVRGKGLDLAVLTRDFDLLRWIGANAYRTSHYPYSEESMQFADEAGIMVIDECPSVDTDAYSAALLRKHQRSIEELIVRDRNHASVIMWSIANEPRSSKAEANAYFGAVAKFARSLDASRPLTAAIAQQYYSDQAAQHLDIIGFNRYNGWYSNPGRVDMITNNVVSEAKAWHDKFKKPVMVLEYGADTMEGLHLLPSFVWTEDYQRELFAHHFRAFDQLHQQGFFIGEFIWNFADFKTNQAYTRVGGNKKGIFTRSRQPKTAALLVRQRYHTMAHAENGLLATPNDLFDYVYEGVQVNKSMTENNELFQTGAKLN